MNSVPNKIGFHFGSESIATGWGSYIRELDAAEIPAVLMSTAGEGFGDIEAVWDNGSTVPHLAVVRCMTHNDVPLYGADIDTAVNEWLDRYVPTIGGDVKKYHQRVITKHGNELDRNHIEWLAEFYTALHPALLERMGWQSHRIACFSFASGNPDPGQWEMILPFIKMAGENPDKFVISLHEYSYNADDIWAKDGGGNPLIGRFQWVYDICDERGWARPHIVSHEWGWRDIVIAQPTAQAMADIDSVMTFLANYPEYLGAGIWTLQKWQSSDINVDVQKLIEPVKELSLTKLYDVGEQPSPLPPVEPPVTPPALPESNQLSNPSFENGWDNVYAGVGDLINQNPTAYTLYWHPVGEALWARNQKTGEFPVCTTVPECLHKLNGQLPPDEQLGGINALILDGATAYKMFANNGIWGAVLSQPLAGLEPETAVTVTVPVQIHYQTPVNDDSPDDVEIWLTAGTEKRVFISNPDLPDREWVYLEIEAHTDQDGRLPIGLRVQTKWQNSRDIFTDSWTAVYVGEPTPPVEPPIGECRGLPRIQYRRVVNVYPPNTSLARAAEISAYAFENGRQTVSGSYDDAMIGDLDFRLAVLWDVKVSELSTMLDWAAHWYSGVVVEFMDVIDDTGVPSVPITITPRLSQRDPAWAGDAMGVCSGKQRTIGGWGCMLTAYTMLHGRYWENWQPPTMMEHMKAAGAMNGGCMNPGALSTTFPSSWEYEGYIMRTSGEAGLRNRVRDYIDAGVPVVCEVDFNPSTGQGDQHWLLVVDYGDNDFTAVDPWTGERIVVNAFYGVPGSDLFQGVFYYPFGDEIPPVVDRDEPPVNPPPPDGGYEYNGRPVTYTPAIHAPADDWRWPVVDGVIGELDMPVKFMSNGVSADFYGRYSGQPFSIVRLMHNFSTFISPDALYSDTWKGEIARFHAVGARDFELHNEPNLPSEGLGVVWSDGVEFAHFMVQITRLIRADFPDVRLWFPGMSPGVPWTNQFVFTRAAWPILGPHVNGFCMHAYTADNGDVQTAVGEIVNQVVELQKEMRLQIPIVVSECSVNRGTDYAQKAAVYQGVDASLLSVPGIQACVYYIIDWYSPPPQQAGHGESWYGTDMAYLYKHG